MASEVLALNDRFGSSRRRRVATEFFVSRSGSAASKRSTPGAGRQPPFRAARDRVGATARVKPRRRSSDGSVPPLKYLHARSVCRASPRTL
jgi:hypothetical protein